MTDSINASVTPSLESLRDARLFPGACCKNCVYAYPVKVTLKDTALDCRATPPGTAFALTPQGLQIAPQILPRFVGPDYFCASWAGSQEDLPVASAP
jgi:hypothetical protein